MNNGLGTDVWKQALDWLGDLWLVTSYWDGCWLSVRGEGHAAGNFPDLSQKDRREVALSFIPIPDKPTGCKAWAEVTAGPSVQSSSHSALGCQQCSCYGSPLRTSDWRENPTACLRSWGWGFNQEAHISSFGARSLVCYCVTGVSEDCIPQSYTACVWDESCGACLLMGCPEEFPSQMHIRQPESRGILQIPGPGLHSSEMSAWKTSLIIRAAPGLHWDPRWLLPWKYSLPLCDIPALPVPTRALDGRKTRTTMLTILLPAVGVSARNHCSSLWGWLAGPHIHSMSHKSSTWRENVEILKNKQTNHVDKNCHPQHSLLNMAPWEQPSGSGGKGMKPCHPWEKARLSLRKAGPVSL